MISGVCGLSLLMMMMMWSDLHCDALTRRRFGLVVVGVCGSSQQYMSITGSPVAVEEELVFPSGLLYCCPGWGHLESLIANHFCHLRNVALRLVTGRSS